MNEYYFAVNICREPVYPHAVGGWLKKFQDDKGFKRGCCHGLRHTYFSLLLTQNVPLQTVSKYMGHSDSTITLQVYSHFIPETTIVMENFFGRLKVEMYYGETFESVNAFIQKLHEYINYYNNERISLKLKMSPVKYRTQFQYI